MPHHRFLQLLRMRRTASVVDVQPVGFRPDGHDFGAQPPKYVGSHFIRCSVGAVHHDFQTGKIRVGRRRQIIHIAKLGIVIGAHRPESRAFRTRQLVGVHVHQPLNFQFGLVGQFEPVAAEKFDAVVLHRIMRCGDHDAGVRTHDTRQIGDARRRHHAEPDDVGADRQKSRRQGGFQHIAGYSRILSDQHRRPTGFSRQHITAAAADLERQLRRQFPVRHSANAVSAKIFSHHHSLLRN